MHPPSLEEIKTYFSLLEVQPGCSLSTLKQAYKKQCRFWHPDRHASQDQQEAGERLRLINEAFAYLSAHYSEYPATAFAKQDETDNYDDNIADKDEDETDDGKVTVDDVLAATKVAVDNMLGDRVECLAHVDEALDLLDRFEMQGSSNSTILPALEKCREMLQDTRDRVSEGIGARRPMRRESAPEASRAQTKAGGSIYCSGCGQAHKDHMRFCLRCGQPLVPMGNEQDRDLSARGPAATCPQPSPPRVATTQRPTFRPVFKWVVVVAGIALLGLFVLVLLVERKSPSSTTATRPPITAERSPVGIPTRTTASAAEPTSAPPEATPAVEETQPVAAESEISPVSPEASASAAESAPSPQTQPAQQAAPLRPVARTYTTTELFVLYKDKHVADRELKGSHIQVVGTLTKVGKDEVALRAPEDSDSVKCKFNGGETPNGSRLMSGMTITVRGLVQGRGLMGNITLSACELVNLQGQ